MFKFLGKTNIWRYITYFPFGRSGIIPKIRKIYNRRPQRGSYTGNFKSAEHFYGEIARINAEQKGVSKPEILSSWNEIVGENLAALCRPIEVNHRLQFSKGSKLIVETPRGYAQQVEMQREHIIERVNITYGFAAIRRLEIRHTSYDAFNNLNREQKNTKPPTRESKQESWQIVKDIEDEDLRTALYELGKNVLAQEN